MEQKHHIAISPEQLQAIGNGFLAYVKPIAVDEAIKLLGQPIQLAPDDKLYCLFNANGAPISISQSYEAAVGSAMEHELVSVRVH
jgi:hypothetical protein